MKILLLSMASPHFFNWTQQLEASGHQVFWLDVLDSGVYFKQIDFVEQITGWRYRWDYPGRHRIKRNFPTISKIFNIINERKLSKKLEGEIIRIKPDVVHSFVMYIATAPVLKIMQKYAELKWIYSAWGSDMFYYQKQPKHLQEMKMTLPHIDYIFTDCNRDYKIAKMRGFEGMLLGVFPGGGGFHLENWNPLVKPFEERDIILIKGYQGLHGKCIEILKALLDIQMELKNYKICIFGAADEVQEFVANSSLSNWNNLIVIGRTQYSKVMELMGKTKIFIGNSSSDGMPNTLLEAIIMGAFPIQSNPGGSTAEIIEDGKNGFLIQNPQNTIEIAALIRKAIKSPQLMNQAIHFNVQNIKPKLKRDFIKKQVLEKYKYVEQNLKN